MNICFFAKKDEKFTKKTNYIADLFFSTYGLDYQTIHSLEQLGEADFPKPDLIIFYGNREDFQTLREKSPPPCHLLFVAQLFHQAFEPIPPEVKRLKQKGTDYSLPILFAYPVPEQECAYVVEEKSGKRYPGITIEKSEGRMEIACYADIFASSFYWLTLQEEKGKERFFAWGSRREREGLHQIPLVNHSFKLLFGLIQLVAREEEMPLLFKSFWPSGSKLAVALTHDVDILAQWILYTIFRKWKLLKKGNFKAWIKLLSKFPGFILKKNKSLYGVNLILDEEKNQGVDSTFFFMAGEPNLKTILKSDITYSIQKAEPVIKKILSARGEIGLHGSRNSYLKKETLIAEKEKLDRFLTHPSIGTRQHFLYLTPPQTWRFQSESGFLYDCTLGYPDRSGFRSGFGFPFQPYDPVADEKIGIWEINTNVMDQTYDKYDPKEIDEIKKEIEELVTQLENAGGGLLTLLWHTNVLDEFGFPGFMKLYGELLKTFLKEKAFVSSGENIVKFWKARNEVKLLERKVENNLWQWSYKALSFISDLTFRMEIFPEHKSRLKIDGASASIKWDLQGAWITFPKLDQNQSFQINLIREKV